MLDLRVPAVEQIRGMPPAQALRHQWPVYLAYVLSFLQVGVVWSNHHSMFHYIRRSDHVSLLMYLMLLLYFSLPGPPCCAG